jgi:hypothetical protein
MAGIPILGGMRQACLKFTTQGGTPRIYSSAGFKDGFTRTQAGVYVFTISRAVNPEKAIVYMGVEGTSDAPFIINYGVNDLGDTYTVRVFDSTFGLTETFSEFSLLVTEVL